MKVLVLGGTGMLGSMVAKVLPDEWEVLVTARHRPPMPYELTNTWWRRFAVDHAAWQEDLKGLADGCDWIVNCLGATKPLMGEDAAYTCNAHFPRVVDNLGPPVIHPSTDCVFAGDDAPHYEHDVPTACDAYGSSKATAEVGLSNTAVLRCSIIGPECRSPARYLLGSALEESVRQGYAHHFWNGLSTLAWAKIAMGIIQHPEGLAGQHLLHLVPAGSCSKDRLVSTILQAFLWRGTALEAGWLDEVVDMRLDTLHRTAMNYLWSKAGYIRAPTIEEMVWELADFCRAEHWPMHAEGWRYWHQ